MKPTLLIIDSHTPWVESLVSFFQGKDFEVQTADTGKAAQLISYKQKFQAVILDLEIKEHSAFEVLRYYKLRAPESKIILTLPNKEYLERFELSEKDLRRWGASEIFAKPVRPDLLFKCIDEHYLIQTWKDVKSSDASKVSEEVTATDGDFTRIRFENFFSGSTTIYDHYIRVGQNKYVKILHQGESFDMARLSAFKDKDLDYLYFKTSDRLTYINFTNDLLEKLIGSPASTIEKKVKLTQSVVDKYLEQVFSSGLKPSLIEEGRRVCENLYGIIEREPELQAFMKTYEEFNRGSFGHLFMVSFFSIIICKNLPWASARTIELVALAGLLHDLGKFKLPKSLQEKDPLLMTPAELELYRTHPRLGVEMLDKFPVISESVKQIVYQHHELNDGTGFPSQLTSIKIYPPAKILVLSNAYTTFLTEKDLAPLEGLKLFVKDRNALSKYEPTALKALITGFTGGGK